jgi:lycopene cyclase domain-containing protein
MTYASLAVMFVSAAALVALIAALVVHPPRRWWHSTFAVAIILVMLTAVFDNLMIATDLFRFDDDSLLGVHLFLVPVEDFAWPVAAALALPALWELMGRLSAVRSADS